MLLYHLVRRPSIGVWLGCLLIGVLLMLIAPNMPDLLFIVLIFVGGLAALFVLLFLERRGGYVSKDKREWFVKNVLAPKLREVVEKTLDKYQNHGDGATDAEIKRVLSDFWAVWTPKGWQDSLAHAALQKVCYEYIGLYVWVSERSTYTKNVTKFKSHPKLFIQVGLKDGPVLLDVDG